MRSSILSVYMAGLQAGAEAARMENIEKMEKVGKTMEERQNHATHYFLAFEYNFWKLNPSDDEALLEEYKRAGVEEFFNIVEAYIKKSGVSDFTKIDIRPSNLEIAQMNLLALAIALHKTNHLHAEIKKNNPNFKAISLKNLLEEGLRYRGKLNNGEMEVSQLPAYAKIVLEHESSALYLMQLRHNILAGYALNRTPGFGELSWFDQGRIVYLSNDPRSFIYSTGWDTKLEKLNNSAELAKINSALDASLATRSFLKSIGIDPVYNDELLKMLSGIRQIKATGNKEVEVGAEETPSFVTKEMAGLRTEFYHLVQKIIQTK